ncbi:hypothetical protein V8C86DRAFT_2833603 [Haematococcus lacustris]
MTPATPYPAPPALFPPMHLPSHPNRPRLSEHPPLRPPTPYPDTLLPPPSAAIPPTFPTLPQLPPPTPQQHPSLDWAQSSEGQEAALAVARLVGALAALTTPYPAPSPHPTHTPSLNPRQAPSRASPAAAGQQPAGGPLMRTPPPAPSLELLSEQQGGWGATGHRAPAGGGAQEGWARGPDNPPPREMQASGSTTATTTTTAATTATTATTKFATKSATSTARQPATTTTIDTTSATITTVTSTSSARQQLEEVVWELAELLATPAGLQMLGGLRQRHPYMQVQLLAGLTEVLVHPGHPGPSLPPALVSSLEAGLALQPGALSPAAWQRLHRTYARLGRGPGFALSAAAAAHMEA